MAKAAPAEQLKLLDLQGLDACNGWTFWHYERNGGLTQIDELRRIARLGMQRAGA